MLQGDWFFVFGNDDIGYIVLICTGYVCIYDMCFMVIGSLYLVMMMLVVLFSFVQGMCVYL